MKNSSTAYARESCDLGLWILGGVIVFSLGANFFAKKYLENRSEIVATGISCEFHGAKKVGSSVVLVAKCADRVYYVSDEDSIVNVVNYALHPAQPKTINGFCSQKRNGDPARCYLQKN